MAMGLLGRKVGMTQVFLEDGRPVPVTVVEAGPCPVLEVTTEEKSGARSVALGFEDRSKKWTNKAITGQFKKMKVKPTRFVREFQLGKKDEAPEGALTVSIFEPGDFVDVTGTSIGKGFQGGMKRWGWGGQPKSHGHTSHRRIGSVGMCADPGRVLKGRHLPGHMGNKRCTVQSLEVVKVDAEHHLLAIKGALPGHNDSFLVIQRALKRKHRDPAEAIAAAKRQEEEKARAEKKAEEEEKGKGDDKGEKKGDAKGEKKGEAKADKKGDAKAEKKADDKPKKEEGKDK